MTIVLKRRIRILISSLRQLLLSKRMYLIFYILKDVDNLLFKKVDPEPLNEESFLIKYEKNQQHLETIRQNIVNKIRSKMKIIDYQHNNGLITSFHHPNQRINVVLPYLERETILLLNKYRYHIMRSYHLGSKSLPAYF